MKLYVQGHQATKDAAGIQIHICKGYAIYTFPHFYPKDVKHQNSHNKKEEI